MSEFTVRGYVDGPGVRKLTEPMDGQFPYVGKDETLDRVEIMVDGSMTPELNLAFDAEGTSSLFGGVGYQGSEVTYTSDVNGGDWLIHHMPDGSEVSDRVFPSYDDMIKYVTGS